MKKILKRIVILLVILIMIIFHTNISKAVEMEEIDYTETLESFENPERGFYQHFFYHFKVSDNQVPGKNELKGNLIHLRMDISDFSKVVNGVEDLELSEDMLKTFDQILKNIQSNGGTAIVRFAYDSYYSGNKNLEPSMDMILRHISQLKPILEENQDVISYIELGFFGPWGEMHSSDICTTDNVSKAIDAMLESAPEKIKIGVRQPKYYVAWANIERSELNKNITKEGTSSYRVGLYNDGYLGSESDLGTFQNREIEIQWLEKQALHTLYGGEVVKYYGNGETMNTAKYMSEEAFRTHTTYLNKVYNKEVIDAWKNEIYEGKDDLYKGQTGYTYISNHLGYRFVLRKSEVTKEIRKNEKLKLNLNIENVGFGNLVNHKVVTIVLMKNDEIYEIQTNLDATKWNSTEIANINFETELPENISLGEWKVYLRMSQYGDINTDNNYQCVRLANNNIWNQDMGTNYLGKFTVLEKIVEDDKKDDDTNEKEDNNINNSEEDEDKNDNGNINNSIEEDKDKNDNSNINNSIEEDKDKNDNSNINNSIEEDKDKNDNNNIEDNNVNDKIENSVEQEINNKTEDNKSKQEENTIKNIIYNLKDDTTSNKNLPFTGKKVLIIVQLLIVVMVGLSVYCYRKMK